MADTTPTRWRYLTHPDAERFDRVTIDTVERWKESELSGDEWRFSYVIEFWSHGQIAARAGAMSIRAACAHAAYHYDNAKRSDDANYDGATAELCCQPGCPNPWTVLLHPMRRYDRSGSEMKSGYRDSEVRAFCDRHRHRGDCGLDDADENYTKVATRDGGAP